MSKSKISPCLWFASEAEEAAKFYTSLLPNSKITHVQKSPGDNPGTKKGAVLVVEFTLAGQSFMALNGGQRFEHSYAVSFSIDCADQAEVDRLWAAILKSGGKEEQCGWIKDRYGMSWQITPSVLPKMIADPDPAKAERVFQAMMGMVKIDIAGLEKAYAGG
jgi:predicted 3-demethylubiquinone-9 3-methyltransferase (glyoxalase superfamily)